MTEPAGSIYDLGYRGYDGVRLGRNYAVLSLYLASLRGIFGLGRRTTAKLFPMGFTVLAFLPAVVQLGVGAMLNETVEVFRPEDYYDYTRLILILFCSAVAPDVTGRDQRNRTLALYFSRALIRRDYALAKLAALATALLFLTLAPQLLLYIGNGLGQNDLWAYVQDEWTEVFPIVLSAILLSAFLASVSLAISSLSSRRAYSTVAIIAVALITSAIAGIMSEVTNETLTAIAILFSPFDLNQGATYWLFDADPVPGDTLSLVDLPGWVYAAAAVVWTVIGALVLVWKFERVRA